MGLKHHTIILVPHGRARFRKWRITNRQLTVGLAVAAGLLIVALRHADGNLVFNPDADTAFQSGDTVIAMGRLEDIERFRSEYGI